MSKVVGIDLGTTNSLVAFVNGGTPAVIADGSGDALLPSIVSVDATGTVYVGREAQRRLWDSVRIVAEPGGATALAALVGGAYTPRVGERVGVLVCGGNTSAVDFGR